MDCADSHEKHVAASFVTEAPANKRWHDNKTFVNFNS